MRLIKISLHNFKISIILFYCLIQTLSVNAQVNQHGIPYIKNYNPETYNAHSQNWAIAKDQRGFMYFGNNFGLLQYDGTSWRLFQSEQSSAIRSLAVDKNGIIYYGSSQDFGAMLPDSAGNLKSVSLFRLYSSKDADFNDIWNINALDNEIFFQSNEKLFRLKLPFDISDSGKIKKNFTVYTPEKAFHWSFSVYGKLYIREFDKGLLVFKNEKLELIPGGEIFANLKIYSMLPYQDGKILICTREKGLFLYDPRKSGNAVEEFKCEANAVLIQSMVYGGAALPNGNFAISSLNNGVLIINRLGQIIEHLDLECGLPDQQVYSIFADQESGNLWFTTSENGIFNVYTGSPFREWNRHNGLIGVVADIVRFRGKIYIATNTGVYLLDESPGTKSRFKPIQGAVGESWDLQVVTFENSGEQKLLVGTATGIFELKDDKATQIIKEGYIFQIKQSSKKRNIFYVGSLDGFAAIEFDKISGKWKYVGKNKSVNYTIRSIFENSNGNIYLGTQVSGFIKLENFYDSKPLVIDSTQGLPIHGSDFKVYQIEGDIVFATYNGLFSYDEKTRKVSPYIKFGSEYSNGNYGVFNIEAEENGYWLSLYSNKLKMNNWQGIVRFKKINGKLKRDESFAKLIPQKVALSIYHDDSFFWIANEKGLYKFDNKNQKNYEKEFTTNITRVTIADDSVLFAGNFKYLKDNFVSLSSKQPDNYKPILNYKYNHIKFEYSAGFYEQEENTLYSYRLVGLEDGWSKWSKEAKFPFSNLPPGHFRFEVKARNIYGVISNVASYEFTILPPWYRTILAYIVFVILLAGFIWLIVKINIKRLQLEKERLEGIVHERTAEIRLKNVELEQQKEEIIAQRDEIEAQRDQVTHQKEQIEDQNKNITDSILYASKIQEALMPPEEVLNELLPEHFILFKPRDIVSGDFYWTNRVENKTMIVAADCTGHGVPGAFMSMLGITLLNEITNKYENLKANQILDELRMSVIKALRQTGKDNEAKDGMDISLCIIDYENMVMQFSGAYNSLLMIRENKTTRFDADRMPIGIYPKEKGGFTNHEIDLKKGDCFYLHSDGYIDQFGGQNGSKLMMKRFYDLLLENHKEPIEMQKKALDNFLIDWQSHKNSKGETFKQIDDILVIGIRI